MGSCWIFFRARWAFRDVETVVSAQGGDRRRGTTEPVDIVYKKTDAACPVPAYSLYWLLRRWRL